MTRKINVGQKITRVYYTAHTTSAEMSLVEKNPVQYHYYINANYHKILTCDQ